MTEDNFLISKNYDNQHSLLKKKLHVLQRELDTIQQKIKTFESTLQFHLEKQIIEEQELTVLYKQLQKAKKEKRLAQKKRGKNYRNIERLNVLNKDKADCKTFENQKERKRLYREAMLVSHPDKFSLNHDKIDLATEITTKLIEIYHSGDLEKLQDYHTHICSGNAFQLITSEGGDRASTFKDNYLEKEIFALEQRLYQIKNKQTYIVLTEYENPLSFIDELKEYYTDRIFKLRKRTRKAG